MKRSLARLGLIVGASLLACVGLAVDRNQSWDEKSGWFIERGLVAGPARPPHLNELIHSASPYLLSHALQPLDWLPWREDSLNTAKQEQQLIYLSIGYETCHWCHVIALESYSDPELAGWMNERFVNIKIDRETQVEVDNRFRRALENLKGEAGWPIQAVLTPDRHILWIDSYLPKEQLQKRLVALHQRWQSEPKTLSQLAQDLHKRLLPGPTGQGGVLSGNALDRVYQNQLSDLTRTLEREQSGVGPRFLRADWLLALLADYQRTGNALSLDLVVGQIDQILTSPTYDAVEGGIHRYATDGHWQVPHFEKMLYDQAQFIAVSVALYRQTGDRRYLDSALLTRDWVEKNLKVSAKEGGLYASSMSAVSVAGQVSTEGDYYRYSPEQARSLPGEGWSWVTNQSGRLVAATTPAGLSEASRMRLLEGRRAPPPLDAKQILSWNALYLLALTELYEQVPDKRTERQIESLASALLDKYTSEGRWYRILFQGQLSTQATLEDLALLLDALTRAQSLLSQASFNEQIVVLRELLSGQIKSAPWHNRVEDVELPSMASFVYRALYQARYIESDHLTSAESEVDPFAGSRDWQAELTDLNQSISQHITPSQLRYFGWISALYDAQNPTPGTSAYFAEGRGHVRLTWNQGRLDMQIALKPGWHINANQLNQPNLLPTRVLSRDGSRNLDVSYPPPQQKQVSFFSQPLALYEGQVRFELSSKPAISDEMIRLDTQACSDKLCLLPEQILLRLPPAPLDWNP